MVELSILGFMMLHKKEVDMPEIVRAKATEAKAIKQKKVNFKICPSCGDEVLVAIEREECDECEVPYINK